MTSASGRSAEFSGVEANAFTSLDAKFVGSVRGSR
jgi:hypothetical protein